MKMSLFYQFLCVFIYLLIKKKTKDIPNSKLLLPKGLGCKLPFPDRFICWTGCRLGFSHANPHSISVFTPFSMGNMCLLRLRQQTPYGELLLLPFAKALWLDLYNTYA